MKQRGSKNNYSPRQRPQENHIEQSEIDSGRSRKDAERIVLSTTVNKQTGVASKKKSDKL